MKAKHLDALEERSSNTRKIKTTNLKEGKYKGNPYMKFKKVKTEPRQKIRQPLRASIPLEDLRAGTKNHQISSSRQTNAKPAIV